MLTPEVVAFSEALLALDNAAAAALLHDAADDQDALDRIAVPSLVQIGNGWTTGEVLAVAGVHERTDVPATGWSRSSPPPNTIVARPCGWPLGCWATATCQGKQMVVHLLRSSGYEVADWGLRLTVDEIVDRVAEEDIDADALGAHAAFGAAHHGIARAACGWPPSTR